METSILAHWRVAPNTTPFGSIPWIIASSALRSFFAMGRPFFRQPSVSEDFFAKSYARAKHLGNAQPCFDTGQSCQVMQVHLVLTTKWQPSISAASSCARQSQISAPSHGSTLQFSDHQGQGVSSQCRMGLPSCPPSSKPGLSHWSVVGAIDTSDGFSDGCVSLDQSLSLST